MQVTNRGMLSTWPAVRTYIFAGNSRFTLVSRKTGVRFTYRVKVKKEDLERLRQFAGEFTEADVTFFVSLLRGPDNTSDYAYMGVLRRGPMRFFLTEASRVKRTTDSVTALLWFLDAMDNNRDVLVGSAPKNLARLEVWHEGRCGRCGRVLTVPKSVMDGMGPECAGRQLW